MATEYQLSYTAEDIDEKLGTIENAVLYTSQEPTKEQKAQARENIGAVDESGVKDILASALGSYQTTEKVLVDNTLAFTAWSSASVISAIDDTVTFTPTASKSCGVRAIVNPDFTKPLKIQATGQLDTAKFSNLFLNIMKGSTTIRAATVTNRTMTMDVDISGYEGDIYIIFSVTGTENNLGEPATISAVRVWQEVEEFVMDIGVSEEEIEDIVDRASNRYYSAPNGDRYVPQVSLDGTLSMVPVVPNKALFIGNSLLIGFGTFGVAASDNQHDYYYLINQAISAKKSTYTPSKMSGTTWEGATTTEAQETFLNNTLLSKLSDDLELVIVQLGDNVNTDEKKAVFADGSRRLLEFIRTNAPKARVVWVGAWYQTAEKQSQMIDACKNTGCTFVDIWDLATTENKSAVGNTYIDANGEEQTITSAGTASHPGDAGFKAIANRLLYQLSIVDTENYYE